MRERLIRPIHAIAGALVLSATTAFAAADADRATLETGRKLVLDAKCEACHMRKLGGDGSSMYSRKDRRVTTRSKLLPQVERCNSELGLGLFPDDEAAIAAHLNATYYNFKDE